MSALTTPEKLDQLLEKLTGVYSSKKTYYRELQQTVYTLATRNVQLELLNRLVTEFHVQESPVEWVGFLGSLLEGWPGLNRIILTLREIEDQTTLTIYDTSGRNATMIPVPGDRCTTLDKDLPSAEGLGGDFRAEGIMEADFLEAEDDRFWFRLLGRADARFGALILTFHPRSTAWTKDEQFLARFTDHLQVCLENALLYRRIQRYQRELRQINRFAIMGEIAGEVAHELNGPLTILLGNAQLLMKQLDEGMLRELGEDILSAGLRCRDAVQRLLVVARGGEVHLQPEVTSLERIVDDALQSLYCVFKERAIDVRLFFSQGPLYTWGVSSELVQMVTHLLSNACDAMQDQPVRRLILSGNRKDGSLLLRCSDTGPGIDPSILPDLFKPFITSKPPGKGTGLGLSSARRIARKYGGDVLLENTGPEGTVFSVLLPAVHSTQGGEVTHNDPRPGR
ncbi:HAMP domain-containing sensor histidine kinase [Kyrpidia sp.]|uniref:sensor histidine kinase n=1 Tax=Kyrpidia sp. TaxID=2073077 RepID=UPI00258B21DA|nr:HAMP domain-containing sensor histidine kinase [Kyrpidia sp.]MCL6577376.1 HAMP domain-containing histidine kinase [Kyrpidia sp.]